MDNMVWIFIEIAFTSINIVLTYLFVRAFLKRKRAEINISNSIVAVILLTSKILTSLFFSEYIIVISSMAIITAFFIGHFYFRGRLTLTVLSAILAAIAGAISELLSVIVITGFRTVSLGEIMQFGMYRMLVRTLSYLFFLMIIILVGRFRKSSLTLINTKLVSALCILPLSSILIVQQFTVHIVDTAYIPTINEVIPMLSIITVNIFVFILVENIMRQNEKNKALLLVEAQSDAQQKHINQLLSNHEQIRQISHDFKQQTDVFYRLCSEKQCDELLCNLSKLSKHHNPVLIIKTGNLMLDTVLSSKKEEADRQKIEFICNLNVQPDLSYMSMEICILLGNAIDNAIEACMRSHAEKKFIELELTEDSSRLLFHMKNSIGEQPQDNGEFLQTKKEDKLHHGIGLRSIKQISNSLGGDMTYEYDDEYFAIWIYFPVMLSAVTNNLKK